MDNRVRKLVICLILGAALALSPVVATQGQVYAGISKKQSKTDLGSSAETTENQTTVQEETTDQATDKGDNKTASARIINIDPMGRFCLKGTGQGTDRPCTHCDPGLRNPDCVDVETGLSPDLSAFTKTKLGQRALDLLKDNKNVTRAFCSLESKRNITTADIGVDCKSILQQDNNGTIYLLGWDDVLLGVGIAMAWELVMDAGVDDFAETCKVFQKYNINFDC